MAVIKTKPPQFGKYNHLIKKPKKDGIMKKKIYFKVYQDKTCTGGHDRYYIEEVDVELKRMKDYIAMYNQGDMELPVFEPIEMTEDEFNKLPEFTGYQKIEEVLKQEERAEKYGERFRQLKELWPGVKIYNCNPQSAITCFDYADIENII